MSYISCVILFEGTFTKEVVENPFTESPVDFHEVCKTIEILSARDPVWLFYFFRLLAWIVKAEEAALLVR